MILVRYQKQGAQKPPKSPDVWRRKDKDAADDLDDLDALLDDIENEDDPRKNVK